jgi:hypothetical protein
MLGLSNSYLCNKFFSVLGMGFFIEATAEIIMPCTEKRDFLCIAHMIFSTGVFICSAVRLLFSYEAEI